MSTKEIYKPPIDFKLSSKIHVPGHKNYFKKFFQLTPYKIHCLTIGQLNSEAVIEIEQIYT